MMCNSNMKLSLLKCLRCGYEWLPRVEHIKRCPKCKSYLWNKNDWSKKNK